MGAQVRVIADRQPRRQLALAVPRRWELRIRFESEGSLDRGQVIMKLFAVAFAGTALTLLAQAPNVNSGNNMSGFDVPALGFVSSETPPQLQPILGIPGSARLGTPLPLPSTANQIRIAPGQTYALVQQEPGSPLSLVLLRGISSQTQHLTLTPIPGAISQVDLVAFSPTGLSVVIYSRQTNQLQVLTCFPNSPQVFLTLPNLSTVDTPQKLAVSDDAQAVLIADGAGSVYSLSPHASPVLVHNSPEISSLAFVTQSRDAIICDRTLNAVLFLQHSSTVPVPLAPRMNNTCQPEAATSTADGKTILVACAAQHAVLSIDRASGVTRVYNVTNSPSTLDRLSVRDAFLMSPPEGGTYWLFVWQPDGPSTFFVAATRNTGQGSGN